MARSMDAEGRRLRKRAGELERSIETNARNLERSDRANGAGSTESGVLATLLQGVRQEAREVQRRLREEYGVTVRIKGL